MTLSRRYVLQGMLAGAVLGAHLPGLAFARVATDSRLVFIHLRGGVDGLSFVPAHGDPDFLRVRGELSDDLPGSGGPFEMSDLDGHFALNPELSAVHAMFKAGEALVLHTIMTGYRARSHFDAQDALDRGTLDKGVKSGWLNRSLEVLAHRLSGNRGETAVGLGATLPLSLRGPGKVSSWSPPVRAAISDDTLARLQRLYARDRKLGPTLEKAMSVSGMAGELKAKSNINQFELLADAAGQFLSTPDGPRIATIDYGNWDSHSNQNRRNIPGPENAYYAGKFPEMYKALDRGLEKLKTSLGPAWAQTTVLVVTEFGRTVHINGTLGTDHGNGGAALLLGGAVRGGRVIADWRGLKPGDLYEGRDLYPSLDMRSLLKGVLYDRFGFSEGQLEDRIFPGSRRAKPMTSLFAG